MRRNRLVEKGKIEMDENKIDFELTKDVIDESLQLI